jgi:NAD-dependent SIR2 family protein deacetylase
MKEVVHCLYCHGKYSIDLSRKESNGQPKLCRECGMALPEKHPESRFLKMKMFRWLFVLIVIFCAVMVVYLPR